MKGIIGLIRNKARQNEAMNEVISTNEKLRSDIEGLQGALNEKTTHWEEAVKRNRDLEAELTKNWEDAVKRNEELYAELVSRNTGNRNLMDELQFLKGKINSLSDLHDDVVDKYWDNYGSKGMCLQPFTLFNVTLNGDVYPCSCSAWLKHGYSIGNVYKDKSFEEIWNSEHAKRLRYSVTEGKFEYCNKNCEWLNHENPAASHLSPVVPRDPGKYSFSGYRDCCQETYPEHILLSHDDTCNLYCLSCRSQIKVSGKEENERKKNMLESIIKPALKDCKLLSICDGEFFFNQSLQEFCKSLTRTEFPNLKISIVTNAQLLTEKKWNEFNNNMIKMLLVSVDATDQQTYEFLRRGAKWEKLQDSLSLISELRKNNEIEEFGLNFVVQKANYRQAPGFLSMAKSFGADIAVFQRIINFGTFTEDEFFGIDVMNPENENYEEAKRLIIEAMKEKNIIIKQNVL